MQAHRWQRMAVLAALTALAGCGSQQQVLAPEPLVVTSFSKAQAVAVTENVLLDMHFSIEKADGEAGYVKTRPLRGGQFFEVWRSDNASEYQYAQSNPHSIYHAPMQLAGSLLSAERAIRGAVIMQKNSYANRSEKAAKT